MDAKATTLSSPLEDLHYMSLTDVSGLIRSGAVSPVEVTETILGRIEAYDDGLKSYLTVLADHARAAAKTAESEIMAGYWRGPLHGVPIAVKDLCNTTYGPTSHGMFIHKDFMAIENATVVERLDNAGAVMLGKLTMTEGAMSGHHPKLKTPVNPWVDTVWTGASSSGSGVATAAGLCYGSLGSDTGGSIRFPSAANGLTGVKPTWGRVSRAGVWALADSFDHVGPMTRTVADAAAMLAVIAGHDAKDPTSINDPVPDYLSMLGGSIAGMRVGIDEEFIFTDVHPEIAAMLHQTIETFMALGARIVPIKFPSMQGMGDYWMQINAAECAVAHAETFPSRRDEYGSVLSSVIDLGLSLSSTQLAAAMQYRLKLNGAIKRAMLDCDLMLVPAMHNPVYEADFWNKADNAGAVAGLVQFTAPFDFTGQPTLSLNGGFDQRGVPIGFQLVGHHVDEATLFKAGHAFQSVTSWHTRHPHLA